MSGELLRLVQVDAYYGSVQALYGLNIDVTSGQAVALLGGNASGKSSTIKTVLGLTQCRSGMVQFDGKNITAMTTDSVIDCGIGSIPEGRRVFGAMTVHENLLMGAFARRREPAERIRRDMDAVTDYFPILAQRWKQPAGTLSGGEQQMLAMGRAWIRRPRLLCIDEPSMGLSPLFVERIYRILHQWKTDGMTILIVDQNAHLALAFADYGYVLQNGQVALAGPAKRLADDPEVARLYLGG